MDMPLNLGLTNCPQPLAELTKRDPRMVERKKTGLAKARKAVRCLLQLGVCILSFLTLHDVSVCMGQAIKASPFYGSISFCLLLWNSPCLLLIPCPSLACGSAYERTSIPADGESVNPLPTRCLDNPSASLRPVQRFESYSVGQQATESSFLSMLSAPILLLTRSLTDIRALAL